MIRRRDRIMEWLLLLYLVLGIVVFLVIIGATVANLTTGSAR